MHWKGERRMSSCNPLDEGEICANFANQPDSEGYTEAAFQAVLDNLLARGIVHRAPYLADDGTTRYRIELRHDLRSVAFGCA